MGIPYPACTVGLCTRDTLHVRTIPRHSVPTLPWVPQDWKNCTLQFMGEPGELKNPLS